MVIADTHAWVWWVDDPTLLSKRARQALEQEKEIGVSAISCWELAMLVSKERLRLNLDTLIWIKRALALPKIVLLELIPEVAVASTILEEFHGDPADRIIAGSAIHHRAAIVTKDRRLRSFSEVTTIW